MLRVKVISAVVIILSVNLFFTISYASEIGTVYFESNKDIIEAEEEIEISINLKDVKTAAFNISCYFNNTKLEYISNLENANIIDNRIVFVWFDTSGGNQAKQGELAKFKFKAKGEGTAFFNLEGEFYDENGNLIKTNFEKKEIYIGKKESIFKMQSEEAGTDSKTGNANLKSLRLDIEGITPNFETDIYEYYLTVKNNVNEIDVLAVSENPNSQIQISGNTNLKEGLNDINIVVISQDKTITKNYVIHVTKANNLEQANNNLETLAIENFLLNQPFDPSKTNYNIEISNELTSVNILAIPQNEKAVVSISGKDNLKLGNNLITIEVTAPNRI